MKRRSFTKRNVKSRRKNTNAIQKLDVTFISQAPVKRKFRENPGMKQLISKPEKIVRKNKTSSVVSKRHKLDVQFVKLSKNAELTKTTASGGRMPIKKSKKRGASSIKTKSNNSKVQVKSSILGLATFSKKLNSGFDTNNNTKDPDNEKIKSEISLNKYECKLNPPETYESVRKNYKKFNPSECKKKSKIKHKICSLCDILNSWNIKSKELLESDPEINFGTFGETKPNLTYNFYSQEKVYTNTCSSQNLHFDTNSEMFLKISPTIGNYSESVDVGSFLRSIKHIEKKFPHYSPLSEKWYQNFNNW